MPDIHYISHKAVGVSEQGARPDSSRYSGGGNTSEVYPCVKTELSWLHYMNTNKGESPSELSTEVLNCLSREMTGSSSSEGSK